MSTPEQPESPQLTRRKLRELRNTASTPIITPDFEAPEDAPAPSAPLPRAAEPAEVAEAPVADAAVDLNAPAMTRRQARLQEKLRTASVPVITVGMDAATSASTDASDAPAGAPAESEPPADEAGAAAGEPELIAEELETGSDAEDAADDEATVVVLTDLEVELDTGVPAAVETAGEEGLSVASGAEADVAEPTDAESPVETTDDESADAVSAVDPHDESADDAEQAAPRVLGAAFGAELLAGQQPAALDLPPSFDQLLARGTSATGSLSVPNALILSQTPEAGSLVSPVTATGEVLITGAFSLPDNYGSTGRAPGTSDGKEIDATLVDGELPPASSPTPIAASAAISTIKSAEDIIKPPAPEKDSRLMMALAITAGVLALALAGVLIVALATGVFR
ncbi:hypothetical protein [Microbacterium invictum]|uniref:Uncharacterized protein n=1 Tax=Microbacterium invictum TaxID=515415 RepID=A0AA40VL40_9MICO|nr:MULTISPECIES: hypothetical protein [Microbacterium]MBB4139049.1 hypothetical protein [Microbacterium invictum]